MAKLQKYKKELRLKEDALKKLIQKGWRIRAEVVQLKHTISVLELEESRTGKEFDSNPN